MLNYVAHSRGLRYLSNMHTDASGAEPVTFDATTMRFWHFNVLQTCCGCLLESNSTFVPFHVPAWGGADSTPQINVASPEPRIGLLLSPLFDLKEKWMSCSCKFAAKFKLLARCGIPPYEEGGECKHRIQSQRKEIEPQLPVTCIEWLLQQNWRASEVDMVIKLVTVFEAMKGSVQQRKLMFSRWPFLRVVDRCVLP